MCMSPSDRNVYAQCQLRKDLETGSQYVLKLRYSCIISRHLVSRALACMFGLKIAVNIVNKDIANPTFFKHDLSQSS